MADPFIGEIRWFASDYAPRNWAICAGQLLSIQQNTALFSLLGTNYGGNGVTTFGLPDLRGRVPIHQGTSPFGIYTMGERAGEENHTLIAAELPNHNHPMRAADVSADVGATPTAAGPGVALARAYAVPKGGGTAAIQRYSTATPTGQMAASEVGLAGNSQPHVNMQPYLVLNACISLQGIYPARD